MRKSIPHYIEIKEELHKEITSGRWEPGHMIPTEREMAVKFGVSRMTARHAVMELEREGLLLRIQGSGTYVAQKKIVRKIGPLLSFSETLRAEGIEPSILPLMSSVEPAGIELGIILKIKPEDLVLIVSQLRLANREPLSIMKLFVVASYCKGLTAKDIEESSLYELMEKRYGVIFSGADQTVEAVAASREEAKLLEVASGFPLLQIHRTAYDVSERPINHTIMTFRGDKFSYRNWLNRI